MCCDHLTKAQIFRIRQSPLSQQLTLLNYPPATQDPSVLYTPLCTNKRTNDILEVYHTWSIAGRMSQCCFLTLLFITIITTIVSASNSTQSTIYIIRHGEKKWALGCLNSAGEHRANLLPAIFNNKIFLTPNHIFANYYDDHIDCERCIQTVTPIAKALNLSVNSTYGYNKWLGGNQLASETFRAVISRASTPTTILVAWEHINIKPLTEALGVGSDQIPAWKGTDYDTIYILQFNATGHVVNFHVSAENITDI